MSTTHAASTILSRYEPVIGLEVHCQLKTESKLFCSCSTSFGALPNHHTCPVCLGYPGVLPVLNKKVVDFAAKMAMSVGAEIHPNSVFARKQYFYPDLPKGYQISQFDKPFCTGGGIKLEDGHYVRLARIHIEEDAGKNVHGDNASYVDLNRAGIPLLEIVTEPDISSPGQAADYLKRVRAIVRYLGIGDGNMEEGSFRCDANVSLKPKGSEKLGTRAEIKNLNSFRNIEKAITYEIFRQADILDQGEQVLQETRLYDAATGKTQSMRSKEESHDYRYFPDPDLPILQVSKERIEAVAATMPELPDAKTKRFVETMELSEYDAQQLTQDRDLAEYYEAVLARSSKKVAPKLAANWILTDLMHVVHDRQWNFEPCPLQPERLAELLTLIAEDTISGKIAKKVFEKMIASDKSPRAIVQEEGLVQISDASEIQAVVEEIVAANPKQVEQFQAGKEKVLGFFVGQVMKKSRGKFNPALVNEILLKCLKP